MPNYFLKSLIKKAEAIHFLFTFHEFLKANMNSINKLI